MKVAIASEGWSHPTDTSMYTHTRDVFDAVRLAGVDAVALPLPSNRGAKVGGLVLPYLRRTFGGYPAARGDGATLIHHVPHGVRRGADVATVHDLYPFFVRERVSDVFFREALRAAIRRPKRVVVTTENMRREVAERFPEHAAKLRVVHAPVRTPEPGIAHEPRFDALWVGRNAPNKNLQLYLSLASDHPTLRFALRSSRSPDREALDALVARLMASAHNVTPLPKQPEEGLDALYRDAPTFVVTSSYEGFHVPAMEAYLRGAKLVLPRIEPFLELYSGGGREVVNTFWYAPVPGSSSPSWNDSATLPALARAFEEAHAAPARSPDPDLARSVSFGAVGKGLRAIYEEVARR